MTTDSAQQISYSIVRRPRRRTVALVIRDDGRLEVLAPPGISSRRIADFVQQKQHWIKTRQQQQAEAAARYRPRQFVDGETFMLLGEPLTLAISCGPRRIELCRSQLLAQLPEPEPAALQRMIERWYKAEAKAYVSERVQVLAERVGRAPASIGIKSYKSRWGTCHTDGRIYLNWRLIMAPGQIIDHVILHELCHLLHPNHSADFRHLLASVDPDHAESHRWLKEHGRSLNL